MIVLGAAAPKPPLAIPPPSKLGGILATLVKEAVEAYQAGQLQSTADASVQAHAGMGMGRGMGIGRGMGRGMGRSMGRGDWGTTPAPAPQPSPSVSREEEVAALKQAAGDLRRQLAEVMERLDNLEQGG